jgi:hypothetical protein
LLFAGGVADFGAGFAFVVAAFAAFAVAVCLVAVEVFGAVVTGVTGLGFGAPALMAVTGEPVAGAGVPFAAVGTPALAAVPAGALEFVVAVEVAAAFAAWLPAAGAVGVPVET